MHLGSHQTANWESFSICSPDATPKLGSDTVWRFYANDTTLVHITNKPLVMHTFITDQLSILSQWAEQWRVTFNPFKTLYMYITNKRRRPQLGPIMLDNTVIAEVASHTNLGILITNKLSWNSHISMFYTTWRPSTLFS